MQNAFKIPAWQRALIALSSTVVGVVVVACLYWAQVIFIPLALAIFFTFLLSPPVTYLQRRGLGRTPSVILVVLGAGLLLGGVSWVAARQVIGLVDELPKYTDNIKQKVKSLRGYTHVSGSDRLEKMMQEITGELNGGAEQKNGAETETPVAPAPVARERPVVIVQPESPPWIARLPEAIGPIAESLGGIALSLVLVVFMLLKREDLRNRLIRLIGNGRVTLTTKAVDEAGHRISRYLMMQAIVNGGSGLVLTLGLLLIGVEYAFLWGFLTAVLRYIPYIGAWISAIPTIVLSLAMFDGWTQPLLVVGLVLTIELISNNVMEPWLYGQSMGVSEVALMVSAAFWAFLWGPIGMVLSSPLTVCLVVLGKYVPYLEFLDVLLGDEPPLEADVSYYQRLLARDQDEASQMVRAYGKNGSHEKVYDDVMIPALSYARRDRELNDLTDTDEQFVLEATREILEDLSERPVVVPTGVEPEETSVAIAAPAKILVFGCPARSRADFLGLEMLQKLLDPTRWQLELVAVETLTAELLMSIEARQPALICISSLPPGTLLHTRYLCKRIRARFPTTKIFVGRWGLRDDLDKNREELRAAGADEIGFSLLETRDTFNTWLPVLSQDESVLHAEKQSARPAKIAG